MKYFPIKFHIAYIFVTLMINFFGPRVYMDYDKLPVFLFIMAYLIIVYIGFVIGFKYNFRNVITYRKRIRFDMIKLVQFCITLSVLFYLIDFFYLIMIGRANFSFSAIGDNYNTFYEYYREKKEVTLFSFEVMFLVISAIPRFISLSCGFVYWNKLSVFYKRLFVTFIVLVFITQTLFGGNQKSIGDIVIFASIALLIKASRLDIKKRFILLRNTALILLVVVGLFSFMQYQRVSSKGLSSMDYKGMLFSNDSYIDFEHPLFKIFGEKMGFGISAFLTGYLSNGYYGLSQALDMPFEWTYGMGNSFALSSLTELTTGYDIYHGTYLYRMEEETGVSGTVSWHTIFPWIASDFTFVGTLFVFLFIAYYYGKSWREILKYKNPVSLMLFSLLTILFMFVPANNQIMHGYDYLLITFFTIILWHKYHNYFNYNYEQAIQ